MNVSTEAGRQYWRRVLLAGGSTELPRWTLDPVEAVAEHEEKVPEDLVAALCRIAHGLEIPLRSVILAAHAKVLAALSGEHEVTTGYVGARRTSPLPCRLTTAGQTWRALLEDVSRAETELLTHRDFPVEDLRRELSLTEQVYETVFEAAARADGGMDPGTVLRVAVRQSGTGLTLLLRYRTDAFDADCAARMGGYHHAALALLAADLDAEHARQSLLSQEELHDQLEGLAGPHRELPDRRMHELFEEQAATRPDAVAATAGRRHWTYRELNSRANRLGRALLARGLRPEGVVAVVTERNLDWMAAVLAIFKAGGAYLPIEPHFPAERIASILSRAGCAHVLTEASSTASLDVALETLSDVEKIVVDAAYQENHPDADLGVAVAPDQLAYIYFTSGSTGEPKGAMCEHAGMLNHLYAKIDDLQIAEGDTVAQTAPQCFDISLWQLVCALLVGGRTVIVEQDVILDVERFVDKIVDERVAVLQVVPSYLEVVVSYLERQRRELPHLRCVSATGEALKQELAQRWFAVQPGVKLVNAYGLTETSDDTNHEVMDHAPTRQRVPLGPAVNNVRVYIVDEHLSPVPLGAPGAIVFSGVCVGRGYVNDPERTGAAYLTDPHRPGERLYRGGDYGRWLPEGKLDFLGRRDSQVKISGFRIEIGEIENALLRVPGVRDGAVVVAERADHSKSLVGFYSGAERLDVDALRGALADVLPWYMVPAALHWRAELPLTANGKIDKSALTALAAQLEVVEDYQAPRTATEHRLARAWAQVLGVPQEQVGRRDHFFDRGGTSLSAVKLAVALERVVSLKEIARSPVLADLAAAIDGKSTPRSGLLQPLTEPQGSGTRALVCLPHAGGSAVAFQPLAGQLRGSGVDVYAVELPGHDLAAAAEGEGFAPLRQMARLVAEEIVARGLPDVVLYGHSAGTALAVETARVLEQRGVPVQRVLLGAQLLGDAAARRAAAEELTRCSIADIVARLSADSGYRELGGLDARRAEHVAAAFRHDCVSAHRYLADLRESPPSPKLSAPVTAILAADDPGTASDFHRHGDWALLAERVELHELDGGGHYFLRTRPAEVARAVLEGASVLSGAP